MLEVKGENSDLKCREKCLQGSLKENVNVIYEIDNEGEHQFFVRHWAVFLINIYDI